MRITYAVLPVKIPPEYKFVTPIDFGFPVTAASALTLLKQSGNTVSFFDAVKNPHDIESFLLQIDLAKPDLLFFEPQTYSADESFRICGIIRKRLPQIKLAACGSYVTALPEETMNKSPVDYVVCGCDFDSILTSLAASIEKKSPLPLGIYYRDGGSIKFLGKFQPAGSLDSLPFIDREIIPENDYPEDWRISNRFFHIYATRGCPDCIPCLYPDGFFQDKMRFRKSETVVEEIKVLIDKYGAKEVFFSDIDLACNSGWLQNFCELLIESKLDIKWSCKGSAVYMDFGALSLMKAAGCRTFEFLIAGTNQSERSKTISVLNDALKVGIIPRINVIAGYPGESLKDIEDIIGFSKTLKADYIRFSIPALPDTRVTGELASLCASAWKSANLTPGRLLKRFTRISSIAELKPAFKVTLKALRHKNSSGA